MAGFRRLSTVSSKAYFQWTVTQGLLRLADGYSAQTVNKDVNQLFGQIQSTSQPGVYILIDFHHHLQEPVAIRHIKDTIMGTPQHTLILLSQKIKLPDDLSTYATEFSLPLPSKAALKSMISSLADDWTQAQGTTLKLQGKSILNQLLEALQGLPMAEAEKMAHRAIWNDGIINRADVIEVTKAKFDVLNRQSVLSLQLDYPALEDIAGFNAFKQWLRLREKVFSGAVTLPNGDLPKGVLLIGVQGCGKSLAAKAVAGAWRLPLLHLDFANLYNQYVGQTESNLRTALATADAMSPCVLWIDEIEKGLSAQSLSDDISRRLLGTFLTWLAEKKSSVFVVATANNVTKLPAELLRKGRFDEVFFVDLPTFDERASILALHLARREQSLNEEQIARLAQATDGFSGAELEQLVVSAMYQVIAESEPISLNLLLDLSRKTKPLSVLMHESIQELRAWSKNRTVSV
jgi:SpoVK/Ycf46/Vps4 family AAA+-type ATPase